MTSLEQHLAAHRHAENYLLPEDLQEPVTLAEGLTNWVSACGCGWRGPRLATVSQSVTDHAAHVAATWREARTVRTPSEVSALPEGALLRDADSLFGLAGDGWTTDDLPALILWHPEDGAL